MAATTGRPIHNTTTIATDNKIIMAATTGRHRNNASSTTAATVDPPNQNNSKAATTDRPSKNIKLAVGTTTRNHSQLGRVGPQTNTLAAAAGQVSPEENEGVKTQLEHLAVAQPGRPAGHREESGRALSIQVQLLHLHA